MWITPASSGVTRTIAGVMENRWSSPFGPIVQLNCRKCHKRLVDVVDLGVALESVNRSELRSGKYRPRPRPQQVGWEAGSSASTRQFDVGPVPSSKLWRFECRCGAKPEAHPDRLLARVKETVARGEHHLELA